MDRFWVPRTITSTGSNITPINYKLSSHFPIVETSRHKYSMELDAKFYYLCRLEISNVDARDIGAYKAVARNASGEGHATINLTFEEGNYIIENILSTEYLPGCYIDLA